jgi:hypothetical protein
VDPVLFSIEAHEEFGPHRNDANQHCFAGLNSIQRDSFEHVHDAAVAALWRAWARLAAT